MMWFVATMGAAEQLDELDTFVVVLAEQRDGTGSRMELQKALALDEADREAGMDTYCLCTQTGATHHGGVMSWKMNGNNLELLLDDGAASELGLDAAVSIELRLPRNMVEEILAGLHRVLDTPS